MKLIFTLLMALVLISCGQHGSSKKANFKLVLPSASVIGSAYTAGSGYKVGYMALSVTGGGQPEIFWSWEGHCTSCGTPPSVIEMDLPIGGSRLVQALVVVENTSTNNETIYYGDTSFEAIGGIQDVVINTSAMATISNSTEKNFIGRYLTDTNAGPSGPVGAYLVVPNNRPPMKVMETHIYDGWFDFFLVDGIQFIYKMTDTGRVIFSSAQESNLTAQIGTRVMHIKAPTVYGRNFVKKASGEFFGTSNSWGGDDRPVDIYVGYWADSSIYLSGKGVCYSASNAATVNYNTYTEYLSMPNKIDWSATSLYMDATGFSGLSESLVGEDISVNGTTHYVDGWLTSPNRISVTPVAVFDTNLSFSILRYRTSGLFTDQNATTPLLWYNTTNYSHLSRFGGGSTTCPSVQYTNHLYFDYTKFSGGHSEAIGISGPFSLPTTNLYPTTNPHRRFIDHHYNRNTETLDLAWNYLPTVISSGAIDGVSIFSKFSASNNSGDGYGECKDPYHNGYSLVDTINGSQNWYRMTSVSYLSFSNLKVLICPFRLASGTQYVADGLMPRLQDGGWGSNSGPILQFYPRESASDRQLTADICKGFSVGIAGAPVMNASKNIDLTLSCTGAAVVCGVFSDNGCSSSISSYYSSDASSYIVTAQVALPANQHSTMVYIKTNVAGDAYLTADDLQISTNGGSYVHLAGEQGFYMTVN